MKTRMILAALLLLALGSVKAQEKPIPTPDGDASKINTLVVNCIGSVYLQQGEKLMLDDYGHSNVLYRVEDSVLFLEGVGSPRVLTIPNLTYLKVSGTASVRSKGQLKGENLSIHKMGTGLLSLEVGYNNIYVRSTGTGDVILLGDCNVFCSEVKGIGKVKATNLNYKVLVEKGGDVWNMAFNFDGELTDPIRDYLNDLVNNAAPFFETESNRTWNISENKVNLPSQVQLDELMRELGENLQQLSDSVNWKTFERDMEQWGADMEEWGREMEKWADHFEKKFDNDYEYHYEYNSNSPGCETTVEARKSSKRSLLLDPHWQGFDAGLNMLIDQDVIQLFVGHDESFEVRPLRSWYFGFNIADVGIAFDRNKKVGMFTGVGLGWNNYSWKNYINMTVENGQLVNTLLPDDREVKNSKFGVLYLQIPLMIEVRPTRSVYVDLGVTGGIRLAAWSRIKYADGENVKRYSSYLTNLLKCDASLRIGGENIGFFVNYALVPLFSNNPRVHPLSLGFSIVF